MKAAKGQPLLVLLKKRSKRLSDLVNGYSRSFRLWLCHRKKGGTEHDRSGAY